MWRITQLVGAALWTRGADRRAAATMTDTGTRIARLDVRAVDVPYATPMRTAMGTMTSASLVLVDLHTDDGHTGRSYVRCYTPAALRPTAELVSALRPSVVGRALSPFELWADLRSRFRLLGIEGIVGLALNAIDMAAWDALARVARSPLGRFLGSARRELPAYASLRSGDVAALVDEAHQALASGFGAVKVKLGGRTKQEDLELLSALRDVAGDDVALMCDYNQSLTLAEAEDRLRAIAAYELAWVEEPLPAGDLPGYRRLVQRGLAPIQAGESWWSPEEAHRSIEAHASDLVMLDVARIGGVTGWLRAAAAAGAAGLRVSSHTFPEFSSHLLAATPHAHLLEWLDSAGPLNATPIILRDGQALLPDTPGAGIEWDEPAIAKYLVSG